MTAFPRYFLVIVLVLIAAGLGLLANSYLNEASQTDDQVVGIQEYVRNNINDLSPEDPVLGGTFLVTEIETEDGVGTVWFEDGHIALVADFTFIKKETGAPRITSFVLRE